MTQTPFYDTVAAESVDYVNHPPHYNNHPSGVECIQITEHMNFNLGNAFKYIWRADEKGEALEDLSKARFYLDREVQRREHLAVQAATEPLFDFNLDGLWDNIMGWGVATNAEPEPEVPFWIDEDEDGEETLCIPLGDDGPLTAFATAGSHIELGQQVGCFYDEDSDSVTIVPVIDLDPVEPPTSRDIFVDLIPPVHFDPATFAEVNAKVNRVVESPEFTTFAAWVSEQLR